MLTAKSTLASIRHSSTGRNSLRLVKTRTSFYRPSELQWPKKISKPRKKSLGHLTMTTVDLSRRCRGAIVHAKVSSRSVSPLRMKRATFQAAICMSREARVWPSFRRKKQRITCMCTNKTRVTSVPQQRNGKKRTIRHRPATSGSSHERKHQ